MSYVANETSVTAPSARMRRTICPRWRVHEGFAPAAIAFCAELHSDAPLFAVTTAHAGSITLDDQDRYIDGSYKIVTPQGTSSGSDNETASDFTDFDESFALGTGFDVDASQDSSISTSLFTADGDATRYGRKFSNDNVNEVLSDALLEALADLLNHGGLQNAWRPDK